MNAEDVQFYKRFWRRTESLLIIVSGGITLALMSKTPEDIRLINSDLQQPIVIQVSQNCSEKFSEGKKYSMRELDAALNLVLDLELKGNLKAASTLSKSIEECGTAEFSTALKTQKENLEILISESLLLLRVGRINLGLLSVLFFSYLLRNSYFLIWSGRFLFPEEIMAELIALKCRRQEHNAPPWKLYLELAIEVLLLLWAVHIQIRLQSIYLITSTKKRNID